MNENKSKVLNFILIGVILFGILLRFKGFLANPSFWHDECAMAWNIKFKSYSELFGVLRFLQIAPPFFSIMTKLLTKIFGFSEMVFRFIPLIFGCLSIVSFYFLASKTLKFEFTVIGAVFLFAINQRLINYSFEFKPYGVDVFFTIICLLFFINLDMEKLNKLKAFIYGSLLAVVPWFSFVSVFIISGGFLNLFFKNIKSNLSKKIALAIPLIISGLIYLKVYLMNNYTGTHMVNYWQNCFVTANPLHFLSLLAESLRYLFFPVQYVLFLFILLIWGIIIYTKEKSSFFNISILSFIILIITSFYHIYPFAERLVLFLIPIFLLIIIKPLDLVSFDKKFKLFIILFLTFFTVHPQIIAVNAFVNAKNIDRGEYPREMMEFLVKNLKSNDIIIVNAISNTEFAYYSSFYDIKNKVIQENIKYRTKDKYMTFLNTLKTGYYWLYLPYDYTDYPVNPWIQSWAETKKVIYSAKNNRSILMYVYVK